MPLRQAIARRDGLGFEKGRLRALRAADDRALQIQIGRALRTAWGESFHAGGTVAIGRSGAVVPYGVRVQPMRQVIGTPPDQVPFVAIFIADPGEPPGANREDLVKIFGLTRREAEIAVAIAQGLSVAEIAAHLEISESTVRTHLANAMVKTGARNHGRLAALVRGLPSWDERP